ncbi:hypothetical protein Ddye_027773 [Dipteronia dyeriana]|uniref:Phorbol-ester/DAG-type domain-containing protein n=1 Tax=Dipteronia dyeriana TaxID=168575 RepID=A0AAD9WRR6_9ROSI|nr:hypothetical protein Ddye_027773 [Dipteronia dyeriana]
MGNWVSYRDDIDVLKTELDNLIQTRNDVMKKIAEEEGDQQQPMKPTNEVQLWLSRVQAVETEVDELITGASEELEKLHPGGMNISMSSSSYELEDMVADKLEAVTNLINEGAFLVADDQVPFVTTWIDEGAPEVDVAETIPAEDVADDRLPIVGMESILKEVWKCLKKGEGEGEEEEEEEEVRGGGDEEEEGDDDVGIIGVYGMGGAGKTTLLKQIYKKLDLEMKNDFDVVIWVEVSRDLQLDKIQHQIGKKIGLFDNKAWKHRNSEERASDILKILKEKKFVLLMDDLWERVDLTKVGVPLPNPENSSKIVFTTRSLQICSLMEADKLFKVTCLSDNDAQKLFKACVGDEVFQSHLPWNRVYRECCGLPLALVSIGLAMASKRKPQEWEDLYRNLRRSMTSFSGWDDQLKKDIRDNLKLSYDNLQNDMFKSCFLYCCLFPRNSVIKKRDLIDYWIGEGFLDERLGAVQSQGHYIIDVLLSVCLLEQSGEDDNSVKMHYWVHDMGLWIASKIEMEKGNCFFCTDNNNLSEAQVTEYLVKATRMSVLINDDVIENLSDAPKCPHLQTLFLNRNNLQVIRNDFFQFMPCLKVLNLSCNSFLAKLPSGISNLISLQHLDLSNTGVEELPQELRALKKLKCLNLEETDSLLEIPRQLISEFSMLHVLRLWGCGFMLQPNEDSVACNDAQLLIEELLCLKNLSMLSISLNNSHALQRLLSSNRLQSCIQSLCLGGLSHPKSIDVPLTDLKHLNTLEISNCEYLGELEVDFVGEAKAQAQDVRGSPASSFYFLHVVIISKCRTLRELTWLILAPNLKHLQISECEEMEEIINVGKLSNRPELVGNVIPFSKLRIITLECLPKLRSIYWTDLPFPDLKKLDITDCPMLPPGLLKIPDLESSVPSGIFTNLASPGTMGEIQVDHQHQNSVRPDTMGEVHADHQHHHQNLARPGTMGEIHGGHKHQHQNLARPDTMEEIHADHQHQNLAIPGTMRDIHVDHQHQHQNLARPGTMREIHADHQHQHQLVLKSYKKPYICDGCKEPGIGSRYRCEECDYDLHKLCIFYKSTTSHNFFLNSTFKFLLRPLGDRFCDGCGKTVRGFLYHCEEKGWDLHPCCMNLPNKLKVDDVQFKLRDKVLKKCFWCNRKRLEGSVSKIKGWSYVSNHEKYHFHVYCASEMMLEGWKNESYSNNNDNDQTAPGSLASASELPKQGRSRENGSGSSGGKFIRITKMFFKILVGILLGDPTATLTCLVPELVRNDVFLC